MTIVADIYTYVVGIDTHAQKHAYIIIEAATAKIIDQNEFPTNGPGLTRALAWIGRRTHGCITDTLISAEGTGSYGTRLTRALQEVGYRVVDAPTPKRDRGKSK